MKKRFSLSCLLLLLVASLLFTSCGRADRLTYDKEAEGYVRRGDGVVYQKAPTAYRAVRINKDRVLATIKSDDLETPLYAVCNADGSTCMDSSVWMADEDYNVYYVKGTKLPTLAELAPTEVQIVQVSTISYSVGEVKDASQISTMLYCYQSGAAFSYTDSSCTFRLNDPKRNDLYFSSDENGLYYVLLLYRYEDDVYLTDDVEDPASFTPKYNRPYQLEEYNGKTYVKYNLGKNFMYDRTTRMCYPVDGLLDSYFAS